MARVIEFRGENPRIPAGGPVSTFPGAPSKAAAWLEREGLTATGTSSMSAVSTPKAQSSQWATGPPVGPIEVRVHPKAATDLADGQTVRLETELGSLVATLRLDERVRHDIALVPKGGMLRDGQCANLLVDAVETDLGGGAAYYDQPARVVAAPPET